MQTFYTEPKSTPYGTNDVAFDSTYRIAHVLGYNDFMAGRGSQPDRYPLSGGAARAERDGYLAGAAAAFDAWHAYSMTNATRGKR